MKVCSVWRPILSVLYVLICIYILICIVPFTTYIQPKTFYYHYLGKQKIRYGV